MQNTVGTQVQQSWIDVGLYQTVDRVRTNKVDYDGNLIPATTKVDEIGESSAGVYFDNRIWWTEKFRSEFGIREDVYNVDVKDLDSINSGNREATLASPKLGLVFGPWDKTEFYVQGGYGFHSNDARADTAVINPDGTTLNTHLPRPSGRPRRRDRRANDGGQ